jgi:hypothetical protein
MTDRKKPGVAFWATVVVVAALTVPVLYVLTLGPIIWCHGRGLIPLSPPAMQLYCDPCNAIMDHVPGKVARAIEAYVSTFMVEPTS